MAAHIHVKPKAKWKKIKIDPNLLANNEFRDLICMEELTDYRLVKSDKGQKFLSQDKAKQKQKKRKKPDTQPCGDSLSEISEESEKTDKQISKTNKKKRKKKKQKDKGGKIVKTDKVEVIDLPDEVMDDLPEKKANTKKRNRKRNQEKDTDDSSDEGQGKRMRISGHVTDSNTDETKAVSATDMKAWEKMYVPQPVLQALQEDKFLYPTPIQTLVLPHAIRDRLDIVGAAETGSGKTLAFGIPVIHNILQYREREFLSTLSSDEESDDSENDTANNDAHDEEEEEEIDENVEEDETNMESEEGEEASELQNLNADGIGCVQVIDDADFSSLGFELPPLKVTTQFPLAIILEPTRELAVQVKNHLQSAARYAGIKIATVLGGMSVEKQKRILKKCPEIIVATPGRLWELIEQGDSYLSEVTKVQNLVIDEADRMIEKGHFEELTKLLGHIYRNEETRRKRQTFVFSATLTMVHSGPYRPTKGKQQKLTQEKKLAVLMKRIKLKEKPKVIDLTKKVGTVETLTEARINCTVDEKDVYLYYFLKQFPGRTLVFTNSKDCIRRLMSIFSLLQTHPLALHADMHQKQRLKNLERFTANEDSLLLASDVAARGLDIPNVQHVIHYQVPLTVENYVHRSGRTARALKEGLSVMLVGPDDVRNYRKIIHTLNRSEDLPLFPVEHNFLPALKNRLSLARQIDTTEHRFNKKKRQNQWFEKAAEEMDMLLDEDALLNNMGNSQEQAQYKQKMKILKSELTSLLQQHLIPTEFSGKYPTSSGKLVVPIQPDMDTSAVSAVKMDKKTQEKLSKSIKFRMNKTQNKNKKWKSKKKKKK